MKLRIDFTNRSQNERQSLAESVDAALGSDDGFAPTLALQRKLNKHRGRGRVSATFQHRDAA